MEGHSGMAFACGLWGFYVEIDDDGFAAVADYHCFANFVWASIDLLMRHVGRHIDEISCLSLCA